MTNLVYAAGLRSPSSPAAFPAALKRKPLRNPTVREHIPDWNDGSGIPAGISLQLLSPNSKAPRPSICPRPFDRLPKRTGLEPASPRDAMGSTTLLQPAGAFALGYRCRQCTPSTRIVRQLCGANCVCLPSMCKGCRRTRTVGGEKRPLFTDRTNRYTREPCSTFVISRGFSVRPLPAPWRSRRPRTRSNSEPRSRGRGKALRPGKRNSLWGTDVHELYIHNDDGTKMNVFTGEIIEPAAAQIAA